MCQQRKSGCKLAPAATIYDQFDVLNTGGHDVHAGQTVSQPVVRNVHSGPSSARPASSSARSTSLSGTVISKPVITAHDIELPGNPVCSPSNADQSVSQKRTSYPTSTVPSNQMSSVPPARISAPSLRAPIASHTHMSVTAPTPMSVAAPTRTSVGPPTRTSVTPPTHTRISATSPTRTHAPVVWPAPAPALPPPPSLPPLAGPSHRRHSVSLPDRPSDVQPIGCQHNGVRETRCRQALVVTIVNQNCDQKRRN